MGVSKLAKPSLTIKHLAQIQAKIIKTPHQPHLLNPFLNHLSNSPTPQNAFLLYNQMVSSPTSHNHYTFTHAIKACTLSKTHLPKGLEIHAIVLKSGYLIDNFIQNSLLHFYLTQNEVSCARSIFSSIPFPNVVSWTVMISGLSKCGFAEEAVGLFLAMNVNPNANTLVGFLSACCSLRYLRFGKAVHGYTLRNFDEDNVILDNSILDFYLKCEVLLYAENMFVRMPKRDVVSWTTMVGGYAQMGKYVEAIEIFQKMVKGTEIEPNEATIVNVLAACSCAGDLTSGSSVHEFINTRRRDHLASIPVGNALINMYMKCGEVKFAFSVFNKLTSKDIISWSTLITGLAMSGNGKQALQVFALMLVNQIYPDDGVFVSLLSGCSHVGLVDQGLMLFKAMFSVYGIKPRMQHYACMVDIYGRAGLLEEAEAFVREMCVEETDGVVWGALLNACKIHGNDEMIGKIKGEVFEKRVSVGTFALLSNAYASVDKWEDANGIRDYLRCLRLKKTAGGSWIEVCKDTLNL